MRGGRTQGKDIGGFEAAGAGALAALALLQACAGDPQLAEPESSEFSQESLTNPETATTIGTRFTFHNRDFFTLTSPNFDSCAGDLRQYAKPLDRYDQLGYTLETLGGTTSGYAGPSGYVAATAATGLKGFSGASGTAGPLPFDADPLGNGLSYKPDFIKNISVDLTDANSTVSINNAYSCSVGSGISAPPVSNCATFDYGAVGGVPTTLGGTLVLVGGLRDTNAAGMTRPETGVLGSNGSYGLSVSCGPVRPSAEVVYGPTGYYNNCVTSMYALAIDALPGSEGGTANAPGVTGAIADPISTWANLYLAATNPAFPAGVAGGVLAFNANRQELLLHAGASPLVGMGPSGPSSDTYQTWIFDVKTQTWAQVTTVAYVDAQSIQQKDVDWDGTAYSLSKPAGGRALFGYLSMPFTAISRLSRDGIFNIDRDDYPYDPNFTAYGDGSDDTPSSAQATFDTIDRVWIIGGYHSTEFYARSTYKFNPTYGPQYMDTLGRDDPEVRPLVVGDPVQWLDNYHTQIVDYNAVYPGVDIEGVTGPSGGQLRPANANSTTNPTFVAPTGGWAISFAAFPAQYNDDATVMDCYGSKCVRGMFPLIIGGHDQLIAKMQDVDDSTSGTQDGGFMAIGIHQEDNEFEFGFEHTAHTLMVANDPDGRRIAPIQWINFADVTSGEFDEKIPNLGGMGFAQGFRKRDDIDVVFWGGTDCRDYMVDTSLTSTDCDFTNGHGRYWSFTDAAFNADPNTPARYMTDLTLNGNFTHIAPATAATGWNSTAAPERAGMAVARGEDGAGNVIIVSFGGMGAPVTVSDTKVIVLWNADSGSGVDPTWVYLSSGGAVPPPYANAAMVFSHITRKFYMYGGYNILGGSATSSDTWELTIKGACPACTATWRQLSVSGGLQCYPSCPGTRRSHRMVEVNYNNYQPLHEPDCTRDTLPCSFGIFMEGGTPDGFTYPTDRWMFDPTGNGGYGTWIKVDGFPPRNLAAIAPVSYYVESALTTVNRAVMFGGQVGLQAPVMASTGPAGSTPYFVPPTLGDTYIYDFDSKTWNRVKLQGRGYYDSFDYFNGSRTELQLREAYAVDTVGNVETMLAKDYVAATGTVGSRTELLALTPPPLAGHVMVTRTLPTGTEGHIGEVTALKIPEVFLFGGRRSNGQYHTLDNVYKFCAGTSGEMPAMRVFDPVDNLSAYPGASTYTDDASCDAYDSTSNPFSPGPTTDYVGRWLWKTPALESTYIEPTASTFDVTPSEIGSFMGGGAYDTWRDKILLFGGMTPPTATPYLPVTDNAGRLATNNVYEYTPPSKVYDDGTPIDYMLDGAWKKIPPCDSPAAIVLPGGAVTGVSSPTGRYGHAFAFDPLVDQVIVTGGYDITGNVLAEGDPASGSGASRPEVWVGKRIGLDESTGEAIGLPDDMLATGGVAPTTVPCYLWRHKEIFGNNSDIPTQAPPTPSLAHAAAVFLPAGGYNTGFYSMFDSSCAKAGPIGSIDPGVSKLLAGGVYIDINRGALGPNENLLLHLTYLPLGVTNTRPDSVSFAEEESAILKIHLVKTGQAEDNLRTVIQPRHLFYADTGQYPQVAQTLTVLAPPTGQVREDQVLLPISIDPGIDRIRLERYSGSAILIDASIYRMGYR